jgi:hypothetical protein
LGNPTRFTSKFTTKYVVCFKTRITDGSPALKHENAEATIAEV